METVKPGLDLGKVLAEAAERPWEVTTESTMFESQVVGPEVNGGRDVLHQGTLANSELIVAAVNSWDNPTALIARAEELFKADGKQAQRDKLGNKILAEMANEKNSFEAMRGVLEAIVTVLHDVDAQGSKGSGRGFYSQKDKAYAIGIDRELLEEAEAALAMAKGEK